MNYLLIQNAGNAPVEGYTLLGMSTTRGCGMEGAIGQFGSGAKHAINVLLRAKLKFWIYCGKTRLDFYTKEETIDDGLTQKTVEKVMCRLGGTSSRTIDCGWVLDFGAIDWNETAMAIREFVSNAIPGRRALLGDLQGLRKAFRFSHHGCPVLRPDVELRHQRRSRRRHHRRGCTMKTLPAATDEWGQAKRRQLRSGYATQWDRRTAKMLRKQERDGFRVSPEQITFCEQVESIISSEV